MKSFAIKDMANKCFGCGKDLEPALPTEDKYYRMCPECIRKYQENNSTVVVSVNDINNMIANLAKADQLISEINEDIGKLLIKLTQAEQCRRSIVTILSYIDNPPKIE